MNVSRNKFREIGELEGEVFQLVESNVHYEKCLDDVRKKMINYLQLINEMESKLSDTVIPQLYKGEEDDQEHQQQQQQQQHEQQQQQQQLLQQQQNIVGSSQLHTPIMTLLPPIPPSTFDFSLLDKALTDDVTMQNLLVGDFHQSPEKAQQLGKDLKTLQLVKELLREKLRLNERIDALEQVLQKVDDKILQDKEKIDTFVTQFGQLDQQLDGVAPLAEKPNTSLDRTESSLLSEGDMELVEVSEMSYDNLSAFMQYFSNVVGDEGSEAESIPHDDDEVDKVRMD